MNTVLPTPGSETAELLKSFDDTRRRAVLQVALIAFGFTEDDALEITRALWCRLNAYKTPPKDMRPACSLCLTSYRFFELHSCNRKDCPLLAAEDRANRREFLLKHGRPKS